MNKVKTPMPFDLIDLAHELRAYLTIIKTQVALQGSRPPTLQQWREFIDSLQEQVDAITRLLENVSLLSKLDAVSIGKHPVDVGAAIRKALHRLDVLVKNQHAKVDVNKSGVFKLKGDSELLKTMFAELIDNAVRNAGPGSKVTITINNDAILIKDSGWGIPPRDIGKVKQPFYRINDARRRKERRSGLGLTLAEAIAAKHELKLSLKSDKSGTLAEIKYL